MKVLQRQAALKLWDQWWGEMDDEWFKIEVRQDYSGEDDGPSLNAWLAGEKDKSIELMHSEMKEWVEMCLKSPARKRRFRIVKEPWTQYTEWEIELFKQVNIPLGGEIVYLVPAEKVEHLDIPNGDVMIFDKERVVRAYYSPAGKVEKMNFFEGGKDDMSFFVKLREELPKYAVLMKL